MKVIKVLKSKITNPNRIEWNRFQLYSALIEMLTGKYADCEVTQLHETNDGEHIELWVELTIKVGEVVKVD